MSSERAITTPSYGEAKLSVTSSQITVAVGLDDYPTLSLASTASLSSTPSWSFGMPSQDNTSIQVGSWLPNSGSYESFYQKNVTNHCLQALSTGRTYDSNGSGKYTEYTASFHSQY